MIEIRRITDIPELMTWRKEVIENVFGVIPSDALLVANREYYEEHINNGTHIDLLAIAEESESGVGSICFSDELPSPDNPSGHCAYLMNIYVRRAFRVHGVGHAIVRELLKIAADKDCGKIYLETTPEGRGVYESLGFYDMPDMMKLKIM